MSRAAAVTIFIYFIISKIAIGIETGSILGLFLSLVFLYFFGKAILGTFSYHKIEKEENPKYKPAPKWQFYIGIPIGLLVVALSVIGIITMTGALPATNVTIGSKVLKEDYELLVSENIILNNEKIKYFYSGGVSSILESGNILTDKRVISYLTNPEEQLEKYELYFKNIKSVVLIDKGGFINPSIYKVNSHTKDVWLKLFLSTERDGDKDFIETLRSEISLVQIK